MGFFECLSYLLGMHNNGDQYQQLLGFLLVLVFLGQYRKQIFILFYFFLILFCFVLFFIILFYLVFFKVYILISN